MSESRGIRQLLSISGETLIPLSFAALILGSGYWVNSVDSRIGVAEKRLDVMDMSQEKFQDFVRRHLEEQSEAISEVKVQNSAISAKLDMLTKHSKY